MNYLAHGYRFLDQPHFVAGTAVPDWLSVADRRVRVRRHLVAPFLEDNLSDRERLIARGILQHHKDDDAFHQCEPFLFLSSELSVAFRSLMPDPYDHRPGFLGHIVTELLLDSVLAERDPQLLQRYYAAIRDVEFSLVQNAVNRIARRSTDRLTAFISRFMEERFLFDYLDDSRLLVRLNQVLRRVKLPIMDDSAVRVLADGRKLLRQHADDLLAAVQIPPPASGDAPAS
jgi:hypothetical protein